MRALRRVAGVLIVVMVVFYAPLAFTYFLNGPTSHRLQDHVLDVLVSPAFAFGLGSGNDANVRTFLTTYSTMWFHSISGSLALVCGTVQFSSKLRARVPRLHRIMGRIYVASALIVALLGLSYLLQTPDREVFAGQAFAEALYLAGLGTITATVFAFVAIRRRNVVAHRELMTLSYAMIWTAPMLRIYWALVAQVWHTTKEMLTISGGVVEGAILFTGAIVYIRGLPGNERRTSSPLASRRLLALAVIVSLVAIGAAVPAVRATDWAETPAWFDPGWTPLVAVLVVPYLVQTAFFAQRAWAASRRGDEAAHVAWRTYLLAAAASPAASGAVVWFAHVVHDAPLTQAWWAGGLGWVGLLFFAVLGHALLTTRAARGTSPVSSDPEPAPDLVPANG